VLGTGTTQEVTHVSSIPKENRESQNESTRERERENNSERDGEKWGIECVEAKEEGERNKAREQYLKSRVWKAASQSGAQKICSIRKVSCLQHNLA